MLEKREKWKHKLSLNPDAESGKDKVSRPPWSTHKLLKVTIQKRNNSNVKQFKSETIIK